MILTDNPGELIGNGRRKTVIISPSEASREDVYKRQVQVPLELIAFPLRSGIKPSGIKLIAA